MKTNGLKDILFYLIVIVILVAFVLVMLQSNKPESPIYSEVLRDFRQGLVTEFNIEGSLLTYKVGADSVKREYKLSSVDYFRQDLWNIINEQFEKGTLKRFDLKEGFVPPWWMMILPYALIIIVFIGLWYFMFNRAGGGDGKAMSFKRARPRLASDEKNKKTFADVEGAEEEKEELREIVDFLKNPRNYLEIGARIPKGVLLVGPPGTGKTLLAKAVAGEAGVQFLSISGSDFVELYVGVGASRVRSLFEDAKKVSPSIIFIDEIDAVGRHRGAGMGGGHDEREQTLNQLLVEMDGFATNEGVIIIAATNRPDILDPALLRPGRFDRQVYIGMPDVKGREAILKLHAKNKPLDETVKLTSLAKTTPGFTGADLENLLNEAALLAARRKKKAIGMSELDEAMLKVIAGPAKKSKVITDKDKKITAYHEAGHAVAARYLEHSDPVHHITIIPRGMANGATIYLPEGDKTHMSKSEMCDRIVYGLGGRVAEKLVFNDITSGASQDIKQVTSAARDMVVKYGMSDNLGPINFGGDHQEVFLGRDYGHTRNYSENIASKIDAEIKTIIDDAYLRCEKILTDNMDKLKAVAEYLLENETMDAHEFESFFQEKKPPEGEAAKAAESEDK